MAHGQWTEIEARGVLEAWRKSGKPMEAYARGRGIVPQRMYWWRKRLGFGVASEKAQELTLLPVHVTERRGTAIAESRRGEPVTVLLRSGHMIKVGRDFDEQTFGRVVALLERG